VQELRVFEGFARMSRPYHSISSVKTAKSCTRAWGYRYLEGLREPEYEWIGDGESIPKRSRSRALGKASHARLEAWQTPYAAPPNWRDLPGQIALSGCHLIPHPERVHVSHVERPLGTRAIVHRDKTLHVFDHGGVAWLGYRDLVVSAPAEFIRLGIRAYDGWALYDYKTTASIASYALDASGLKNDAQAALYALATCEELSIPEVPARWVYLETKRVRRATAVDATITPERAAETFAPFVALALELDTVRDIGDTEMNPLACAEYGGCYYHVSNGGPCNAQRSVGALVQARNQKEHTQMALSEAARNKLAGLGTNGTSAGLPPPDPSIVDAPVNAADSAVTEAASSAPVPTPPPAKRGRPAKASAPAGGLAARMTELTAELAQAEALLAGSREAVAASEAKVAAALAAIREACGA
jgi:hypothetical protein